MNKEILKKGNDLNKKIGEFQEALNCFEWTSEIKGVKPTSTNPRIIVEFDDEDGGRSQLKLPMSLSDVLVDLLKQEIKKGLESAKLEFESL